MPDKLANGWELFEKIDQRLINKYVTFYASGDLALTKAVSDAIGSDTVALLYNPTLKKMRIISIEPEHPGAYKLRQPPKQKTKTLSARTFMRFYGLELHGKKFAAICENGHVTIDITKPISKNNKGW